MKKIIAILILSFLFIQNTFALSVQVGSMGTAPSFSIYKGDDIEYVVNNGYRLERFDKNGVDLNQDSNAYGNSGCSYSKIGGQEGMIESENYKYFLSAGSEICGGSSQNTGYMFMRRYDKTAGTWETGRIVARWSKYAGDYYNMSILVDENKIVLNSSLGKREIDFTNPIFEVLPYTGSVATGFTSFAFLHQYRVSLNTLMYLDEATKELIYKLKDIQGDILTIGDIFVSTWTFKGYKYLYDTVTAKVYLSIYGNDDVRAYSDYTIGTVLIEVDSYFPRFYDETQLLEINSKATMGYNFTSGNYNQHIHLINPAGIDTFYRAEGNLLYKDSDVNIEDFLINYGDNGGGGTGGNTGTGAIDYDDTIFNWDADGDGDIELLNGEVFAGIANMFKYFFGKIMDFFTNIKNLVNKLGQSFTSEVKTFSFIPSTHAEDSFAIMFNTSVDEEAFEQTTLGKFTVFFKGFAVFFVFIIGFIVFIGINRQK